MTEALANLDEAFPLGRTRARMLRVDHAGERGAVAVYTGQLLFRAFLDSETVDFLQTARTHEIEHRAAFREAMRERGVTPCATGWLWIVGGFALGVLSVFGGRRGIMACTAAIERAVHGHLGDQIAYLGPRDPELAAILNRINVEEVEHMRMGEAGFNPDCRSASMFTGFISSITHTLIFLSTFGDSSRLARAMEP